jgi:hypothetical protein
MSTPMTDVDEARFEQVIFERLGIPNDATSGLNPLVRALLESGITRWSNFLMLSAEHIHTLTYKKAQIHVTILPPSTRRI